MIYTPPHFRGCNEYRRPDWLQAGWPLTEDRIASPMFAPEECILTPQEVFINELTLNYEPS